MAKAVNRYESDGATPAQESYDEGAVRDGQSTPPRRLWVCNASTAGEVLEGCRFRVEPSAGSDGHEFLEIAADSPLEAPGQPTAALTTGIALEIGAYEYAVTFVTANGETTAGERRGISTTSGNQKVNLSDLPTGPAGTTARRVYRTEVGGSDLFLVGEVPDNETATYHDDTLDEGLGDPAPTLNTSGSPGAWQSSPINLGDLAVGDWAGCWMRLRIPQGTTQVGNPRRACCTFEEALG